MKRNEYTRDVALAEIIALGPKVPQRNVPPKLLYFLRREFKTLNNAKREAGMGYNSFSANEETRKKVHETRVAIRKYLAGGPATFNDMMSSIPLTEAALHNRLREEGDIRHVGERKRYVYYLNDPEQEELALQRSRELSLPYRNLEGINYLLSILDEAGPIPLDDLQYRSGIQVRRFNSIVEFEQQEGDLFFVPIVPASKNQRWKFVPEGVNKNLFLAYAKGQESKAARILLEFNGISERYSIAIPNIPKYFKAYPEKLLDEMKAYHLSLRI